MHSTLLAKARLGACRRWPAATAAILSLVPVERRRLGSMAVDKHWRLYFDPEYLAGASADEAELVILHEVSHLLLRHHERGGAATDWELWNWSTDCSINFRLQAEGHTVPPEWLLPARLQLSDNQTAEQYYRQLEDRKNGQRKNRGSAPGDETSQQPADAAADPGANDQPEAAAPDQAAHAPVAAGAGDPPDNETADSPEFDPVKPGTSGSCADGQQRPWEESPPADEHDESKPPALPKHEQEQVLRDVAERIAKQAGTGAGSWSRWAQEIIAPRVGPKAMLVAAVRQAVEQTTGGQDDVSYRRPARRPGFGGVIRPGSVTLVPRVLVIVDSSGSMGQQDLALALGLIGKVLNGFRLRDGVRVMVGDTAVQSVEKVFDPKKLEIKGGGGTEIDRLIVEAVEIKPRPQLIVIATDGYTSWPSTPVGIPVVACLTQDAAAHRVPKWIKTVVLI